MEIILRPYSRSADATLAMPGASHAVATQNHTALGAGSAAWPAVGVVIATRDRPELLARAIAGVFAQDYPGQIELLIVFDQCEPPAMSLEPPPNVRVRFLENRRTAGLPGARNTGVRSTTAEYVAFCDDDDEWLPQKLRRQVDALQNKNADAIVTCGISVCSGTHAVNRIPSETQIGFDELLRSRRMELHPSTFLLRRDHMLDNLGLVDEAIPGGYAEDYDFLLRAASVTDIVVVREPLVRVHWNRPSFFAARWRMIRAALIYLLEKHEAFARAPKGRARIYGQIAIASAGCGDGTAARGWAMRCLRLDPLQARGWIGLAAAVGIVRPDAVVRLANAFGRGI